MFMRPYASHAPRKTYRDIADGFDRMGNVPGFGYFPQTGFMPGITSGDGMPQQACGLTACQTCGPTVCEPIPEASVGRCVLLGMPRICIPGCDCETVEVDACDDFTMTGVYISPKIASELSITNFRVGCWNMLGNCDAVPAEVFSCCELDNDQWSAKKLRAGTKICLTFENESDEDIRLHGCFKGILCETC